MKISNSFKYNIYFVLILISLVGINKFTKYLSSENLYWFSSSQGIEAFDGISWGTSKNEIERLIGRTLIADYKSQISEFRTKEEITEFEKQYLLENDWKYVKEVDSNINEFEKPGKKKIFGLDFNSYHLKFYKDRLYEINFINSFDYKRDENSRNLLLGKFLDNLENKFGKPIRTNYDRGTIVKYSNEFVIVEFQLLTLLNNSCIIDTHIKFTPIIDKIKIDISQYK